MLLIEKMKHTEDFTILERQISEYILEHRDEIFNLSLAELSNHLYVSKATIIRYFKKLGFSSYRELCVELAKELSLYENNNESVTNLNGSDTPEDIAKKIQQINTNALAITYEYLNFRDIEEMADIIRQYNRIYLFGIGKAGLSAAVKLRSGLIGLGKDTSLIDYNDMHAERYKSFDRKSIIIFSVYNDENGTAAKIAGNVHSLSLPVMLLCGPFQNKVESYASRIIRTMYTEEQGSDDNCGSVAAMEYLSEILYYALRSNLKTK